MKYSAKTKLDELTNARDGFKCVECGKTHGIQIHHIIPDLEELDNLLTLCHRCHKRYHNMSGCFGQGLLKDEIRKATQFKKGNKEGAVLMNIIKTHYYNRYIGEWVIRSI